MDIEKVRKASKKAFEEGSAKDAGLFMRMCLEAAFADHTFRGLELTRLDAPNRTVEGKSWHHVFKICRVVVDDKKLWEVTCSRSNAAEPLTVTVLLDRDTMEHYTK